MTDPSSSPDTPEPSPPDASSPASSSEPAAGDQGPIAGVSPFGSPQMDTLAELKVTPFISPLMETLERGANAETPPSADAS